VAQRITGVDLSHFFEHAVRGTEDLPLRELLAAFGVELRFRPGKNGTDRGGKAAEEEDALRH
jgi:predicted metalloprotease with PDZ domain